MKSPLEPSLLQPNSLHRCSSPVLIFAAFSQSASRELLRGWFLTLHFSLISFSLLQLLVLQQWTISQNQFGKLHGVMEAVCNSGMISGAQRLNFTTAILQVLLRLMHINILVPLSEYQGKRPSLHSATSSSQVTDQLPWFPQPLAAAQSFKLKCWDILHRINTCPGLWCSWVQLQGSEGKDLIKPLPGTFILLS